ncbi:MAG: hypothetical protein ACD_46C00628G0002 [uncultured bacterium]|nr:MAG: hypothetical protein ACD_46C00628G0002 [uncultured bacterium]
MKKDIYTDAAPAAIGTYSQAIQSGHTIYLSGQIPLHPKTMMLVSDEFSEQVKQVFKNLEAVCVAGGGHLNSIVRLTIYLIDLTHFSIVNEIMAQLFQSPFPARTTIQVSGLPKGAQIEIDAVMVIDI